MGQIRQQDQSDEQKINDRKCDKFLKRTLKFVISVSVFNFIVWYSCRFCILPHSFKAYFSACVISSMLTPSLERNYMFLICNAILAFLLLANTTSPFSSPPAFDIIDHFHASPIDVEQVQKQEEHYEEEEEELSQGRENVETASSTPEEEEEEEVEVEGTDEEAGRTERGDIMDTTMVANQELGIINTEELNRKFEEFIRKMKEEIRIEAQTHPIVVV